MKKIKSQLDVGYDFKISLDNVYINATINIQSNIQSLQRDYIYSKNAVICAWKTAHHPILQILGITQLYNIQSKIESLHANYIYSKHTVICAWKTAPSYTSNLRSSSII